MSSRRLPLGEAGTRVPPSVLTSPLAIAVVCAVFGGSVASAQTTAPIEPVPAIPQAPVPPAPAPAAPPSASTSDASRLTFTARPGQGFTATTGDAFALTIRPRIQLRDTLVLDDDVYDPQHSPRNEIQIKTLRLWMLGHVINRNIRYGIQLAFGPSDFEKTSFSPIYDAFFDFTRSRDFSIKVGQYFVPFDRSRTIREFALQTVDRTAMVAEMTLDRDVGISIYSNDFLGRGGRYGYALGLFGGEGRNRVGFYPTAGKGLTGDRFGFLYTARFSYRPFGSFDEDAEGDLTRTRTPKLLVGVATAYDQNSVRTRGTTGEAYYQLRPDYVWAESDVVFKYRGFAFMGEVVMRYAPQFRELYTPSSGTPTMEYSRRALGYLVQASYYFPKRFELWSRFDELRTPWSTDPQLVSFVNNAGRTLSGGVNYYLNGHAFKIQLQIAQTFQGPDDKRSAPYPTHYDFRRGLTYAMLQLDATF